MNAPYHTSRQSCWVHFHIFVVISWLKMIWLSFSFWKKSYWMAKMSFIRDLRYTGLRINVPGQRPCDSRSEAMWLQVRGHVTHRLQALFLRHSLVLAHCQPLLLLVRLLLPARSLLAAAYGGGTVASQTPRQTQSDDTCDNVSGFSISVMLSVLSTKRTQL